MIIFVEKCLGEIKHFIMNGSEPFVDTFSGGFGLIWQPKQFRLRLSKNTGSQDVPTVL